MVVKGLEKHRLGGRGAGAGGGGGGGGGMNDEK